MAKKKKKSNQTHSSSGQKGGSHIKKGLQDSMGSLGALFKKAGLGDNARDNKNKELSSANKSPKNYGVLNKESAAVSVSQVNEWERMDDAKKVEINIDESSRAVSSNKTKQARGRSELFSRTQLTNSAIEESELVIGLDFGTACTKAVIRDNSLQKAYAVPFDKKTPYLISTELLVNNSGVCGLDIGLVTGDDVITDIKLNLIDAPDAIRYKEKKSGNKITAKELSVAYIALILREIRCWFFKEHREKYKNSKLVWELNIGVPSRSYEDQNMCNVFRSVALAAWNLSAQDEQISLDLAQAAFLNGEKNIGYLRGQEENAVCPPSSDIHPQSVEVIPEVIAEIVGYDKSPMRSNGLHLLIDIGAGTVDITSFIIQTDDEGGSFNLLTTEVEMYGAFKLHKYRIDSVKSHVEKKLSRLSQSTNGMTPLPEVDEYSVSNEKLQGIDKEFMKKFNKVLDDVFHETKSKRYPLSPAWAEGLRVFVGGGGSQVGLYMSAIKSFSENVSRSSTVAKFNLLSIPKPEDLDTPSLEKKDYHRVAVANGLSFTFDDVKKIEPPHKIEDHVLTDSSVDYRDNYISSDMT